MFYLSAKFLTVKNYYLPFSPAFFTVFLFFCVLNGLEKSCRQWEEAPEFRKRKQDRFFFKVETQASFDRVQSSYEVYR